jgi:hypothetical protein
MPTVAGKSRFSPDSRFTDYDHFVSCVVLCGKEAEPIRRMFPRKMAQKKIRKFINRLAKIADGDVEQDICGRDTAKEILAAVYTSKPCWPWRRYGSHELKGTKERTHSLA